MPRLFCLGLSLFWALSFFQQRGCKRVAVVFCVNKGSVTGKSFCVYISTVDDQSLYGMVATV